MIKEDVDTASNAIPKDCVSALRSAAAVVSQAQVSALRGCNSLIGGGWMLYSVSTARDQCSAHPLSYVDLAAADTDHYRGDPVGWARGYAPP